MNSLVDSQEEHESGITSLFSTYGSFFAPANPTGNDYNTADTETPSQGAPTI